MTSLNFIEVIEANNVDNAWLAALKYCFDNKFAERKALLVSIEYVDGQVESSLVVRNELDRILTHAKLPGCTASAQTIFPYSLWLSKKDLSVEEFCNVCLDRLLPRIKSRSKISRRGTYFERMMRFDNLDREGKSKSNQLENVISAMKKSREPGGKKPRQTMLQLAVYDPLRDFSFQIMQGFPCLQQISISFSSSESFVLHALYPVQNLTDRAYGNYLGLMNLGQFIAHHTSMNFSGINCFVTSPRFGKIGKRLVSHLVDQTSDQ